jgi:glucokinase
VSANRVIGVDLGGTKIAAGVIDRTGAIVSRSERETPTIDEDTLLAALDDVVADLWDDEIGAIGLGVPSTVDQRTGRAVMSVNIPFTDVPLRERVAKRFGVPCGIDNDGNAAAIAEWQVGAGRGTRHMIMLTLGTGVGGGLILDGRPYRGFVGAAAELGHIVVEYNGRPCQGFCTGRGHLEAYATGVGATSDAEAAFGEGADSRLLLEKARGGDATALAILDEIGRRLGAAMGSLVNIFNPEAIIVGGGWGEAAGDFLLEPAREVLRREALAPGRDLVRVLPAALGPEAGLVGAGFVAFEALDSSEAW